MQLNEIQAILCRKQIKYENKNLKKNIILNVNNNYLINLLNDIE